MLLSTLKNHIVFVRNIILRRDHSGGFFFYAQETLASVPVMRLNRFVSVKSVKKNRPFCQHMLPHDLGDVIFLGGKCKRSFNLIEGIAFVGKCSYRISCRNIHCEVLKCLCKMVFAHKLFVNNTKIPAHKCINDIKNREMIGNLLRKTVRETII